MTRTEKTGPYSALANDRWDTLTIGVQSTDAEQTNSDLIDAWMASTREILGRMIHGVEDPGEYTMLCKAEDRLLGLLGDIATDLCEAVEAQRHTQKAGTAA